VAAPCDQADLATATLDAQAIAVIFGFVDLVRAGGHYLGSRRQAKFEGAMLLDLVYRWPVDLFGFFIEPHTLFV